jgi:hypothetical protein
MTLFTAEQDAQIINRYEAERRAALPQLTDKMKSLCAELEKAESLKADGLKTLKDKTYGFLGDFESDFSARILPLRPDVPEETQKMYVALHQLVDGLE